MSCENIENLTNLIKNSDKIVVFTGAGISTESGISDYRSKGGLWRRFQPVTIQEFIASEDKRKEYWQTKLELYESLADARPNEGHKAVVRIEEKSKLHGLITQNIDGLHDLAGTSKEKIVELHGTNLETICLDCEDITSWQESFDRLQNGEEAPKCHKCSGVLKPNTISFGQSLKQNDLDKAMSWASQCDLMLALGSTLVVEPAASLPQLAKQNGAKLVIITNSETPLDHIADLKIADSIGDVLSKVLL